jgi:2-amino-4-hydroxy-6-hydroxymethyldihydropteridine diphosphokinase
LSPKLRDKLEEKRIYTLLLGSNLGDRARYLHYSKDLLEKRCGKIVAASAVHETEAWGKKDQDPFLNQALMVDSALSPAVFLREIQEIENSLGRRREEKWGPRTIDIDILFISSEIIAEEQLKVPHPLLHQRSFALEPVAEILPEWEHPLLGKTIREMIADLNCAPV